MNEPAIAFIGTFGPPRIEFDGHVFSGWSFSEAPWLFWMAWHARRGDVGAIEVLKATSIVLTDLDGKVYWPVG